LRTQWTGARVLEAWVAEHDQGEDRRDHGFLQFLPLWGRAGIGCELVGEDAVHNGCALRVADEREFLGGAFFVLGVEAVYGVVGACRLGDGHVEVCGILNGIAS